jgi:hypothetical protein
MDEAEWLAFTHLNEVPIDFLNERVSDRKRRLFAVACCRRIWHLLERGTLREVVQAAEEIAEGMMNEACLASLRSAVDLLADPQKHSTFHACAVKWAVGSHVNGHTPAQYAKEALGYAASRRSWSAKYVAALKAEQPTQNALLRDIAGNPFRPVTLSPAWHTPAVLALAQAAYDNRSLPAGTLDPERLAVLADALEEAGCTDADILGHLRGPGPHVRGCFVIDTLLDKS